MNAEKPTPPEEWECCGGGCTPCVWDHYYNELSNWQESQSKSAPTQNNQEATDGA